MQQIVCALHSRFSAHIALSGPRELDPLHFLTGSRKRPLKQALASLVYYFCICYV